MASEFRCCNVQMAKRQFWVEVIRRRAMVRGKAAHSSASCVGTFQCLPPVLLMNLSMSTTWASHELFNVYYLGFLWTCQCLQPVLLMNLSMPTHTVLLMNLSTCQRWQGHQSCFSSVIPWFSKGMLYSDMVIFKGHVWLWCGGFAQLLVCHLSRLLSLTSN